MTKQGLDAKVNVHERVPAMHHSPFTPSTAAPFCCGVQEALIPASVIARCWLSWLQGKEPCLSVKQPQHGRQTSERTLNHQLLIFYKEKLSIM